MDERLRRGPRPRARPAAGSGPASAPGWRRRGSHDVRTHGSPGRRCCHTSLTGSPATSRAPPATAYRATTPTAGRGAGRGAWVRRRSDSVVAFLERWAGAIPALLNDLGQDNAYEGPRSIDPEALERVSVPVLILRGEQTLLTSLCGSRQSTSPGMSPKRTSANCRAPAASRRWSHPNSSPRS